MGADEIGDGVGKCGLEETEAAGAEQGVAPVDQRQDLP